MSPDNVPLVDDCAISPGLRTYSHILFVEPDKGFTELLTSYRKVQSDLHCHVQDGRRERER